MKKLFLIGILFISNVFAEYYSQIGQDKYVYENFFKNKTDGFFVDIGAHDGITASNTYFFEKEMGWSGICFEPLPNVFKKLIQNRSCTCINACISDKKEDVEFVLVTGYAEMLSGMLYTYDPRHWDRLKREIKKHGGDYEIVSLPTYNFNEIMSKNNVARIDYLSIDTEGSELEILKTINFEAIYIKVISVENNYREPFIKDFLESKGFRRVAYLGNQDEIFLNLN